MPNFNTNYTYSAGVAPAVVEYYERTLLENMQPEMVHNMDAQKRTLPLNNGKTVQFRKFSPFPAITTPLSEGVTPDGQTLTETALRAMVKPYGGYVSMTDEMQWYMLDNMHQETAKLLADQAALSLDSISRDALHAGLNVQYVGQTARSSLTTSNRLTYAEIKKAVRTLKRNNCKPFADGFYHAIVHPDVVHDLTSDTMWTDVSKYYDKQPVQKYELGTIYKVKFFESTNAKVFTGETYWWGTTNSLSAKSGFAYSRAAKAIELAASSLTADQARLLTGKLVYVYRNVVASSDEKSIIACIDHIDVPTQTVFLKWDPTGSDAEAAKWAASNSLAIKIYGDAGAGSPAVPVFSTLVYGQNAFGSVELGGTGRNVEVIVKEPGSSGSEDPLNQRGTIAWKVKGFCSIILQDDFIVRIESGATA